MIIMTCNWCGMTIDRISYRVVAVRTDCASPFPDRVPEDLHFDCLPKWVAYMQGGESPPILKKEG
jgi:hypothetical protein